MISQITKFWNWNIFRRHVQTPVRIRQGDEKIENEKFLGNASGYPISLVLLKNLHQTQKPLAPMISAVET